MKFNDQPEANESPFAAGPTNKIHLTNHLKPENERNESSPSFHVSSHTSSQSDGDAHQEKKIVKSATVKSSEEEVTISCVNKAVAIKESIEANRQMVPTQAPLEC